MEDAWESQHRTCTERSVDSSLRCSESTKSSASSLDSAVSETGDTPRCGR